MSQLTSRNRSLDMAKGLMILWVPTVHLIRWDMIPENISHIPETLFSAVMVSFFILSGYVHKPGKRSYGENLKHTAVGLLRPFAVWSLLVLIADLLYLLLSGRAGDVPGAFLPWLQSLFTNQNIFLLGKADTPLGMMMHAQMVAFWFVGTMAVTDIFFFAAAPLVQKSRRWTVILAAGLLVLSGILRMAVPIELPFILQEIPAWTAAMLLGCLAGQVQLFEKCPLGPKGFWLSCLPVLTALWFLYPLTGFGSDLGDKVIWHPAARIGMGFLQLYVIVFAFRLLKDRNPVGRIFSWIGRNTLTILLSHMLIGSFVSLILHLYSLGTWTLMNPGADIYSAPPDAVTQGICLWAVTVPLCLLVCFIRERIKGKVPAEKSRTEEKKEKI